MRPISNITPARFDFLIGAPPLPVFITKFAFAIFGYFSFTASINSGYSLGKAYAFPH